MSVNEKMTALADEIRELSGTTTSKSIDAMTSDVDAANAEIAEQAELLEQITTALEGKAGGGGITLPDLSNPASASDILSGKEAIDENGNKITGTIVTKTSSNLTASGATVTVPAGYYATNATKSVATATQATPSVSINSSGLITASATQTAGYVSAGTKSGTKQLTTQAAKTVTPTTSNQTAVASGRYTTGAITVKGDANLKAENIASGVSIFGVTGTHSGAEDLNTELTEQENLISQLSTILDNKASGGSGGASVETCTVTISFQYGDPRDVWIAGTQLVDGNIVPFTFVDHSDEPQSFSSPLTITNIVKNTLITVIGSGSYAISSTSFTCSGCEVAFVAISAKTVAIKVTDVIASCTIRNDY